MAWDWDEDEREREIGWMFNKYLLRGLPAEAVVDLDHGFFESLVLHADEIEFHLGILDLARQILVSALDELHPEGGDFGHGVVSLGSHLIHPDVDEIEDLLLGEGLGFGDHGLD